MSYLRGKGQSWSRSWPIVTLLARSFRGRRLFRPERLINRLALNLLTAQMFLVGICLGLALGILFVPFEMHSNCKDQEGWVSQKLTVVSDQLRPASSTAAMITELKNNSGMTFRRPRYFSTELGLRKKLIVGILVTRAVDFGVLKGLNQTLAQRVDKLVFFVPGNESEDYLVKVKSLGLTGVTHVLDNKTKSGSERVALKAVKYFGDKFYEQFDYFYLITDKFWINGRLLVEIVARLSVTDNFIMGVPLKEYCSLEHGIIMSRRVVRKIAGSVDQCLVKLLISGQNSMDKCFRYALQGGFTCQSTIQGLEYTSSTTSAPTATAYKSVVVGPLKTGTNFLSIQTRVSKYRMQQLDKEIDDFKQKVRWLDPKIPIKNVSWPIGIPHQYVPKTRFEVLTWNFHSDSTIFGKNNLVASAAHGIDTLDFQNLLNSTRNHLSSQHIDVSKLRLRNSYSQFDPTRGMNYILDFKDKRNNTIRVEGVRPLSKMEFVPMPFVTENQRVTVLVPIIKESLAQIRAFMDRYFDFTTDKKLNTVLIFVILTRRNEKTSKELKPEEIEDIKKLIGKYNKKVAKSNFDIRAGYIVTPVKTNVYSALETSVEAVIKRIVGTTALILTGDVNMSLKDEFLNRVRMNTILGWQVFSPIPFMEYNPSVYLGRPRTEDELFVDFDVNKNSGYFEPKMFSLFSFYAADFIAARKLLPVNKSVCHELEGYQDFSSLLHLFIRISPVHVFRTTESSLKIPFSFPKGCSSFESCVQTKWASRSQLAKLILQSHSSVPSKSL